MASVTPWRDHNLPRGRCWKEDLPLPSNQKGCQNGKGGKSQRHQNHFSVSHRRRWPSPFLQSQTTGTQHRTSIATHSLQTVKYDDNVSSTSILGVSEPPGCDTFLDRGPMEDSQQRVGSRSCGCWMCGSTSGNASHICLPSFCTISLSIPE